MFWKKIDSTLREGFWPFLLHLSTLKQHSCYAKNTNLVDEVTIGKNWNWAKKIHTFSCFWASRAYAKSESTQHQRKAKTMKYWCLAIKPHTWPLSKRSWVLRKIIHPKKGVATPNRNLDEITFMASREFTPCGKPLRQTFNTCMRELLIFFHYKKSSPGQVINSLSNRFYRETGLKI